MFNLLKASAQAKKNAGIDYLARIGVNGKRGVNGERRFCIWENPIQWDNTFRHSAIYNLMAIQKCVIVYIITAITTTGYQFWNIYLINKLTNTYQIMQSCV